ncbi:MAG: hypothetical protein ABI563_16405 [Specibacter sp.]
MSLGLTLLVLLAALFHSSWNAIAKSIPHRLASATLIALVHLVSGAVGVFAFGVPATAAGRSSLPRHVCKQPTCTY